MDYIPDFFEPDVTFVILKTSVASFEAPTLRQHLASPGPRPLGSDQ